MKQDGSLKDGYTGPYDEGSSVDRVRRTNVSNEIDCERGGQMPHPWIEPPRMNEYSSSSHNETSKTLAPHFVVPTQPLFPIAPIVLRSETKIIQADKIFELPGRKDRPSHVSYCVNEIRWSSEIIISMIHMSYSN